MRAVTEPTATPLLEPRDGVPPVVSDQQALLRAADALAAGAGPVAVDAERASGYRYGQAAYLVQLRREGAGTFLVDPVSCPDLSPIGRAIDGEEWVLHAAGQDLPCLAGVGLRPTRLFDTELGARLAGLPRVGLGAVVEQLLGLSLAKEHSAVDWSTRPLPESWLRYAALDVEVLIDLRNALADLLHDQGKLEWAAQEFAAIAAAPTPSPRVDPWRRTSGVHRLRSRRQLALVRELWRTRDALARKRDLSPGRLLPDAAVVEAAAASPRSVDELLRLPGFRGPAGRRHAKVWLEALARGRHVPDEDLPPHSLPSDGPPPPRAWADRDPDAAARLAFARAALTDLSERCGVPVENLLTPDTVRRLMWSPPLPEALDATLTAYGARPWQIELVGPVLREALAETAATRTEPERAASATSPPSPTAAPVDVTAE